jgi:hypothetical protein
MGCTLRIQNILMNCQNGERERHALAETSVKNESVCTVYSTTGTTWLGSPLWKEAKAAMTVLVYSRIHKRIYRGYVQVYWLVYVLYPRGGKQNGSPFSGVIILGSPLSCPDLFLYTITQHAVSRNAPPTLSYTTLEMAPRILFLSKKPTTCVMRWLGLPGMVSAAVQALRRLTATTSSRDPTLMVKEQGPQRRTA